MIRPVARNYARAFLNVFDTQLSKEDMKNLSAAVSFLKKHRRAVFLLTVPTIKRDVKRKGVRELCARFRLSGCYERLFDVLFDHRRSSLLLQVLESVLHEYDHRHNIVMISVSSSVALQAAQKEKIQSFVQNHFNGVKQYRFTVDPTLIAGVKISSGTLLWESSVQKYLRACARSQMW